MAIKLKKSDSVVIYLWRSYQKIQNHTRFKIHCYIYENSKSHTRFKIHSFVLTIQKSIFENMKQK